MADRADVLRAQLLATFRVEAEDHVRAIRSELDVLGGLGAESDPSPRVETLFRVMHTLKGAARSVAFTEVEATCHRCEQLLQTRIKSGKGIDAEVLHVLVAATDTVEALVNRVEMKAVPPGMPVAPAPPRAAVVTEPARPQAKAPAAVAVAEAVAAAPETIRVDVGRLDRVVTLSEDLLLPKLASVSRVAFARSIAEDLAALRSRINVSGIKADAPALNAHFAQIKDTIRSLETRTRALAADLQGDGKALRTVVDDLYDEMHRVRLMPASVMLASFPSMVRDLCRETGKDVALQIDGAELELDRKVLDLLKDPLIHLVRNAIDHGIESPDERVAKGKPRRGRLSITIERVRGARVRVEVSDDGGGFDTNAIRDAVVRARLSSPERIMSMDDNAVIDLAYNAGVSTSPVVTTISGHGRGLAIVRERIERVEGIIATRSTAGGTTVRLELSASIATYRGLLVMAAGVRYLLPIESVERAIGISPAAVRQATAQGSIMYDGRMLAFARLDSTLRLAAGQTADEERRTLPAVVLRSQQRRAVFLLDEVLGEREVMVKGFAPPLIRVQNVLAAGLLGTGELVLILRPADLLVSMHREPLTAPPSVVEATRTAHVLVVDDSVTTRTMERNVFESAGYSVSVAADGFDAWSMLQSETVDIVVSDVDMPRMNGFELTARIRGDRKLANLPVVLVTALETREDKERGIGVGANAYVLKSGFNQSGLLDIVRRLL